MLSYYPFKVAGDWSNTDTALNLNTTAADFTSQFVPLVANEAKASDLFTRIDDNVFQCEFFGEILIAINIHLTSPGARNALQCRMVRDPLGVPNVEGPIASTGYIRNSTGHSESSLHLVHVAGVGQGAQFACGIRRESTNTAVTNMRFNGTSHLAVARLR